MFCVAVKTKPVHVPENDTTDTTTKATKGDTFRPPILTLGLISVLFSRADVLSTVHITKRAFDPLTLANTPLGHGLLSVSDIRT